MAIAARLQPGETLGDRILKVDHAGEHGAVSIYGGQILACRWRAPSLLPELRAFRAHERRHRALFAAELERRGLARCRSYALCGIGGWALGVVTGLLGPSSVAATTVAVERVVLRHLEEQLAELRTSDPAAHAAVAAILADEQAHHDRASATASQGRLWRRAILPVVSAATEVVIWLGMRL